MKEPTTKKYEGLGEKESILLLTLARQDKKIFSIKDARKEIEDPKKTLHNLVKKRWLLRLKRGLYAIVPLEIGPEKADAYTIHNLTIPKHLINPYYISHWTALNYHGLSEEIPQTTFTTTLKPKKPLKILDTNYYFIKTTKKKFFGWKKYKIEEEKINISDKEKTIADCLDHPQHTGGIDEVAKAIYFNTNQINLKKIEDYLTRIGNNTALKRYGFILDSCNINYQPQKKKLSKGYGLLDPLTPKKGPYNNKWLLQINQEIKPSRWRY